MILRIKEADFSANNIGQVEMPYIPEAETTAYFNVISGSTSGLTYAKSRAINTFIKGLKTNNLWSKVSAVNVPLFGRVDGGVNIINPSQNIGFPTGATYTANGVRFSNGFSSPWQVNRRSQHMGFYNTTASDGTVTKVSMSIAAITFGRAVISDGAALIINQTVRPRVLNHAQSIGAMLESVSTASGLTYVNVDGEASSNVAVSDSDIASSALFPVIMGGANTGTTSLADYSHGLFTYGAALSTAELSIYSSLITNMMTALTAA